MNHEELQSFTHEDLSSFTYEQLSLDKYKLIFKVENENIKLPDEIKKQLYALCSEIDESMPKEKSLFTNLDLQKIKDFTSILLSLISIIEKLHKTNLLSSLSKILDLLMDFLKQ